MAYDRTLVERVNAALDGVRDITGKPRSTDGEPVAFLKIEEHGRIATRCNDPSRGRSFLEFVIEQKLSSLCAFQAILSIKQKIRSAIRVQNPRCI